MSQDNFKPTVVWLIINGRTEEALTMLSSHYRVATPKLKVGLPKKHKIRAYGCYTAKNQTIAIQNSDVLINPFVILHEFYHHLRSKGVDKMHRGTESNADKFALDFLMHYQLSAKKTQDYIS